MTPETILDIGYQSLYLTVLLAAPLLGTALFVGLVVGIIQAATQIQEMTLSFIPKLLSIVLALFWVGAWMLRLIIEYTQRLFHDIPGLVG